MKNLLALAVLGSAVSAYAQITAPQKTTKAEEAVKAAAAASAVREITIVNLEYQGTKVWVPGTLIVKKGEKVRLTLINNAPSGNHGFAIDEFGVKEVVAKDEPKTVEFTADKAGLFRSYCQLHSKHVGGELLVIE